MAPPDGAWRGRRGGGRHPAVLGTVAARKTIQMTKTMATARSWSSVWAGYAAAGWAVVFAVRGVYWGLGGTVGLGTLSRGIQEGHANRDPALFAALWITVALEVLAAMLALALTGRWGQTFPHRFPFVGGKKVPGWLLLTPAWGAGTLLVGHGALFVSVGLLAASGVIEPTSEIRWYALVWGPWFMLGGILFTAAGWSYLRRSSDRRTGVAASILGAIGGLAAAGAPFIVSAIAQRP